MGAKGCVPTGARRDGQNDIELEKAGLTAGDCGLGHVPVANSSCPGLGLRQRHSAPHAGCGRAHGAGPMDSEPHLDLSPPLMSSSKALASNSWLPTCRDGSGPDGRRSAEVGRRRLVVVDLSLGLVPAPVAGAGPGGGPVL